QLPTETQLSFAGTAPWYLAEVNQASRVLGSNAFASVVPRYLPLMKAGLTSRSATLLTSALNNLSPVNAAPAVFLKLHDFGPYTEEFAKINEPASMLAKVSSCSTSTPLEKP